ncbi:MAG: hypothetical protein LBE85_13735 [Candidatus Accumulibacter sp.]|jgi:hypothetical protein|nr:hypothetical protein [Accumulibacter sp.]
MKDYPSKEMTTMNDLQALQAIDAGMRTLFDNFVQRMIETHPEMADTIKDISSSIVAGNNKLFFLAEVGPFVECKLTCYVQEGNVISCCFNRIFDGRLADSWPGGTRTVQ